MDFRSPTVEERNLPLYREIGRAIARFSIRPNGKMVIHIMDTIESVNTKYTAKNGKLYKNGTPIQLTEVLGILNKKD